MGNQIVFVLAIGGVYLAALGLFVYYLLTRGVSGA